MTRSTPSLRLVQEAPEELQGKSPEEPLQGPPDLDTAFASYAPYVASLGQRILGRQSEVEDLVQDVFLQAHRSWSQLREAGATKGWLARITVRMASRRLRTRRLRRWLHLDEGHPHGELVAPGASPEQRALLARVYEMLDGLSADQRLAWTLRHVEGEPLAEVARLCACSLSTAKRRVQAAQIELERGVRS